MVKPKPYTLHGNAFLPSGVLAPSFLKDVLFWPPFPLHCLTFGNSLSLTQSNSWKGVSESLFVPHGEQCTWSHTSSNSYPSHMGSILTWSHVGSILTCPTGTALLVSHSGNILTWSHMGNILPIPRGQNSYHPT